MMSGLEKILMQSSYYFSRPNDSSEYVSGDDLEEIKATKISGAIEFVDNIKNLPQQIRPEEYLNTLFNILERYASYAVVKEATLEKCIKNLEQRVNQLSSLPILSIYDRLYKNHYYKDNWYLGNKKKEMLRYLLTLHNKIKRPFSKDEIKSGIEQIPDLLQKRDKIRNELHGKNMLFKSIQYAIEKINTFKETQQVQ